MYTIELSSTLNIFSRFIQKLTLVQITQTSDKVECGNVEMTQLHRKGNSEATGIPGCPLPIHSLPLLEIHTKQSNPTHQTLPKHPQSSLEPLNFYIFSSSNIASICKKTCNKSLPPKLFTKIIHPFWMGMTLTSLSYCHTHKSVLSEEHEAT